MGDVITAVYEKGVLRPLETLALAERSQVKIQILETTSPSKEVDEARRT